MSETAPQGKMDFDSDFGTDSNKSLKRPWVAFFHFFFRISALLVYLFGTTFSGSFIGVFVTVILLLSLDFWTVKNVSGRIMVGLRWWNYINDKGESHWVFESRDGSSTLDSLATNFGGKADARLFWIGLVVAPVMWVIFFLTAFFGFSFRWLILVIIGITMSFSNLFGYLRCRLGSTQSISNMANSYMQRQMLSNVFNMFKGKTTADASAANPQASNVI